jgi:hypothetical protein
MRFVKKNDADDPTFVEWLDAIIAGVFDQTRPKQLYVLRVDNWFGKKWLGFSGKLLGTFGVRKRDLTLPPFIPSRIVSQHRFVARGQIKPKHPQIHVYQQSGENLNRKIELVLPGATLFWFSSRSKENARASAMAYVLRDGEYWSWYVAGTCGEHWRIVQRVGITETELDAIARWRSQEG